MHPVINTIRFVKPRVGVQPRLTYHRGTVGCIHNAHIKEKQRDQNKYKEVGTPRATKSVVHGNVAVGHFTASNVSKTKPNRVRESSRAVC